jgi:hypothetical protein
MRSVTTAAQSRQSPYRKQNAATSAVAYASAPGAPSHCLLTDARVGAGHAFLACARRAVAHGRSPGRSDAKRIEKFDQQGQWARARTVHDASP